MHGKREGLWHKLKNAAAPLVGLLFVLFIVVVLISHAFLKVKELASPEPLKVLNSVFACDVPDGYRAVDASDLSVKHVRNKEVLITPVNAQYDRTGLGGFFDDASVFDKCTCICVTSWTASRASIKDTADTRVVDMLRKIGRPSLREKGEYSVQGHELPSAVYDVVADDAPLTAIAVSTDATTWVLGIGPKDRFDNQAFNYFLNSIKGLGNPLTTVHVDKLTPLLFIIFGLPIAYLIVKIRAWLKAKTE